MNSEDIGDRRGGGGLRSRQTVMLCVDYYRANSRYNPGSALRRPVIKCVLGREGDGGVDLCPGDHSYAPLNNVQNVVVPT